MPDPDWGPGHKNRLIRAPTAEKRQSGHGFASIRAREAENRQSGHAFVRIRGGGMMEMEKKR